MSWISGSRLIPGSRLVTCETIQLLTGSENGLESSLGAAGDYCTLDFVGAYRFRAIEYQTVNARSDNLNSPRRSGSFQYPSSRCIAFL
jgi:hypothetical protein